jgi:hypothetical protein
MQFKLNGIVVEVATQTPQWPHRSARRFAHVPLHRKVVAGFNKMLPVSVHIQAPHARSFAPEPMQQPTTASSWAGVSAPRSRTSRLVDLVLCRTKPHADRLGAATTEFLQSVATSVVNLTTLDMVLGAFERVPDLAADSEIERLSYADRSRLLHELAQRIPKVDDADPYRSLAREAILAANDAIPVQFRQDLSGLESGLMFADEEAAVRAGVPVAIAAKSFEIEGAKEIQRLNWVANQAAAGHIYAGASVTQAAELHGITEQAALVPLQMSCTKSVASAAVIAGMTVADVASKFGIDDAQELDALRDCVDVRTRLIDRLLAGVHLDQAIDGIDPELVPPRHEAEYIAALGPAATAQLKRGRSWSYVARQLGIADPYVVRLLQRRAHELQGPPA